MIAAADALLGEFPLGAPRLPALTVGKDQGSERGGDEQARDDLEGEEVLAEEQASNAFDVAAVLRVGSVQADRRHPCEC